MKRGINIQGILIIIAVMVLVAAGIFWSRKLHQNISVSPDLIRIHLGAEPSTLNPLLSSDAYGSEILSNLFDSLVRMDPDTLEYTPKMAERWEISPDHKIYTFYLKKGIRWHDGHPFTADDILFSFKLIQDPKLDIPFLKVYYKDLQNVVKVDDYTVRFEWSQPYFLSLSFCGGFPLLPKHLLENSPDFEHDPYSRMPIGQGPYKIKKWLTNKKIVLERNEDYWDKKPEIKTIEYKIVADDTIGLQVLKKGELDYYEMRAIQWARQTQSVKFNRDFRKFVYMTPGFSYIGWNMRSPYFKDAHVRLAMSHMVDKQKIIDKISFGLGKTVTGPFFPFSNQYNKDLLGILYNRDKAKELLSQAGWRDSDGDGWLDKDGVTFAFTFLYPSAAKITERVSTILKEDLKKIGINMKIDRMEWAAFLDKLKKYEFDATALGWAAGFQMDPYQIFHSSQAQVTGGSNYVGFMNKQADQIIERARVEFDEDKRNQMYREFHKILYEEQPYTFLYVSPKLSAVSRRFDNIIVHKAGLDIMEWKIKMPD